MMSQRWTHTKEEFEIRKMSEFQYGYFRSEAELRAGVLIWQIVSPFLIIFGTFGNILSVIILSKRKFNRWASTVYLIGLSVADLCVLYVGLLRQWVKYTFDSDIRFVHPVLCKVHWWLMYTCADIPVWILTAVTVERLISSLCPYKSKKVCTKNRAKVVLLVIVITALLINSHLLYGFGRLEIPLGNETLVIPCAPLTEKYEHFFGKEWTWIDLCKYSLIPFAFVSTGNICIIYKLLSSGRKLRTQVAPTTVQPPQISTVNERTSNMTILLVILNFVFLISTSPVCIYFIGEPYWIPKDVPRNIQLQDPWWAVVNMLMYTNNAINFLLYCLAGSRFRDSVRQMLTCLKKAPTDSTVTGRTANSRTGAM